MHWFDLNKQPLIMLSARRNKRRAKWSRNTFVVPGDPPTNRLMAKTGKDTTMEIIIIDGARLGSATAAPSYFRSHYAY